jgi:hypothetical protein
MLDETSDERQQKGGILDLGYGEFIHTHIFPDTKKI